MVRLLRRFALPALLFGLALVGWLAADRSDFNDTAATEVLYERRPTTPMLSARRLPRTLRAPVSDGLVTTAINGTVEPLVDRRACAVVRNGDRILAEVNPALPLVPASNQKLMTTWAALEVLGPDFSFSTRVAASAPILDGVVDGDLYFIGDGDPFLYTEDWIDQYDDATTALRHHTRLETLAQRVAESGVTAVTGRVLGDESLFDTIRVGPWANRLTLQRQSGPLSALTVNENFVSWPADFNLAPLQLRQSTDNPALQAAAQLNQLLQEQGISIGGAPGSGIAPPTATEVATISSPPLTDIITHINTFSSNIGAELLTKRLGVEVQGEGSTAAGVRVITDQLQLANIPLTGVALVDGSGLSESNLVTCAALGELLAKSDPEGLFGSSLAVSGEQGSLTNRFVDSPAEGLVLAKTGTLMNVASLSGYVRSGVPDATDEFLVFSQIFNDTEVVDLMQTVQEPLVEVLATYPAGPPVAELSPSPAAAIG